VDDDYEVCSLSGERLLSSRVLLARTPAAGRAYSSAYLVALAGRHGAFVEGQRREREAGFKSEHFTSGTDACQWQWIVWESIKVCMI
jgi:hypothetical protein